MKLYYEKCSSTSWSDTYYWLCETIEEYDEILNRELESRKKIENDFLALPADACFEQSPNWNIRWMYYNWHLYEEQTITANEYYYGHEWCGKHFTAFGFGVSKRYERNTRTDWYMKPGSIDGEGVDSSVGQFTGYGS